MSFILDSSAKTNWKFIGIVAILGVLVIGGALILPMQKEVPSQVQIAKPEALPVDSTANWQTYRNEEFGFEVKYPEGWEVKNSGVVNVVTGSTLSIIKNNNPDNLMLDEWFRDATLIGGRPTVKAAAKLITINGAKAYRFDSNLPPPALYFEVIAVADSQRNIFSIYGDYQFSIYGDYRDPMILEQILSTFRFIE